MPRAGWGTHSSLHLTLLLWLRWDIRPGAQVWAGDGGAAPCSIGGAAECAHSGGLLHHVHLSRGSKSLAQSGRRTTTASGLDGVDQTVSVCFQVVVVVNDGSHEFFTKVSPRLGLCAGNWHRITGEKSFIKTTVGNFDRQRKIVSENILTHLYSMFLLLLWHFFTFTEVNF